MNIQKNISKNSPAKKSTGQVGTNAHFSKIELAKQALERNDPLTAIDICNAILKRDKSSDISLQIASIAYNKIHKRDKAIEYIRAALKINPTSPNHINTLANYLVDDEDLVQAEHLYKEAINLDPSYFDPRFNLGRLFIKCARYEEAETCFQHCLPLAPTNARVYQNIGVCLFNSGRPAKSIHWFTLAHHFDPTAGDVLVNLALAHAESYLFEKALSFYEKALDADPEQHEILLGMIMCHIRMHNLEKAENLAQAYLDADFPAKVSATALMTTILKQQGRLEDSIEVHKKVVSMAPESAELYSNMLLDMIYTDSISQEELFKYHLEYAQRYETPVLNQRRPHTNTPNPNKKIKIGYVSADLYNHSVAYFALPLISKHDRGQFEVYCYSNSKFNDATTMLFQKESIWRQIDRLSDAELAHQIQKDEIDILVDLSGHTGHNRLRTFALKPAPVQIGWLGYPFSTGLSSMDYRLVDKIVEPEGASEHISSEALLYLPNSFSVYRPSIRHAYRLTNGELDILPAPALKNGYVTFGCCNNVAKLTKGTLQVWAKILQKIENARLLLEVADAVDTENLAKQPLAIRLIECGIPIDRVIFSERRKNPQYSLYHKIDIALDPFPCNGGTTTCDALWMSIPVVSLQGNRFMSRMGATLLTNIGHPEWLANSEDEYIDIAVNLASDVEKLNQIRKSLRGEVEESPIMNEVAFARNVERIYRAVWGVWCANHANPEKPTHNLYAENLKHETKDNHQELVKPSQAEMSATAQQYAESIFALYNTKSYQEALSVAGHFLSQYPENAFVLNLQGLCYLELRQYDQAKICFDRCVALDPTESTYHNNLGNFFYRQDNVQEAITHYSAALALNPTLEQARFNLALCQSDLGQNMGLASPEANALLDQATTNYQLAIELNSKNALTWNNLGYLYMYRNRPNEAEIAVRRALKINPDLPEALVNLANLVFEKSQISAAIELLERALSINPHSTSALNNLSSLYACGGDAYQAAETSQKAVLLEPHKSEWHDTLLLNQLYSDAYTDEDRNAMFSFYRKNFEDQLPSTAFRPHLNSPMAGRRLNIAYVSGDFRRHSVSYFLENLFQFHNKEQFKLFFYHNSDYFDSTTERYKRKFADEWRNIFGLSSEVVAELARDDEIDILIDLSGHTKNNMLPAFARKPAPVQVTWLGYPDTTGLNNIDYQIVDPIIMNSNVSFGTETKWPLEGPFCTYTPFVHNPERHNMPMYQPKAPPALENGYVTFGCASNLARLTPHVVKLWSRVLHAVPDSVLLIDALAADENQIISKIQARFTAEGVSSDRIRFKQRDGAMQYLLYHHFDIALDLFPSNAGTTTLDALWMGVPVVTRCGHRYPSRIGASVLTHIGHPEWIAHDDEAYVEIATKLASDLELLSKIRANLRTELAESSFMDGLGFTKSFEKALREMWQNWCASEKADLAREFAQQKEALSLCDTLTAHGMYNEAIEGYKNVLRRWPQCGLGLYGLGIVLLEQNEAATAKEFLKRAADATQNECQRLDVQAKVWGALGHACIGLNQLEEAATHFQHSLALFPSEEVMGWLDQIPEEYKKVH